MNNILPPKKFNMERDAKLPLTLYFFNVIPSKLPVPNSVDFRIILSYGDIEAIDLIKKEYPIGTILTINKTGQLPVKTIIDAVNLNLPTSQNLEVKAAPSKEQFIHGLMLSSDRFIKSQQDKETIKIILNKIKDV